MKRINNMNVCIDVLVDIPGCIRPVTNNNLRIKYTMNTVRINGMRSCSKFGFLIVACFFLMAATSLNAQVITLAKQTKGTIEVKGLVRDAQTKKPIAAVQVKALNHLASATTDKEGNFIIKIVKSDEVLLVKAYDYAEKEVPVQSKDRLVIDLYPSGFSTYYTNQLLSTGSVRNSTIVSASKTIPQLTVSQALTADELIKSEVGGDIRSINRSGVSGMGASLFIRGYNSLLANAQPLFVVDGVIMNNMYDVKSIYEGHFQNPLLNIDINDIESITEMKDGTSIYGSKASNGVILIKTTRGKDVVTKINLNISAGLTTTPKTTPVMGADDYRIYLSDIISSAGYTQQQVSTMYFLQSDPTSSKYNKYHNNTDWNDEVYQTGLTQSYMININGGDDKALYYFSLGYTKNDGVVKTSEMSRLTTRFNSDINLTKNLTLGVNISYTNLEKKPVIDGVESYTSPTYLALIKSPFLSPHTFTSIGYETVTNDDADEFGIGNPSALLEYSMNYTKQHYFDLGLLPTWNISRELTLSSQINYTLNKFEENRYDPVKGTATRYFDGYGYSENRLSNQLIRNESFINDSRLKYKKVFNTSHQLDALLGWRYINNYFELDYIEAHNSGSDNNTLIKNSYDYLQTDGLNNHTRSVSNYASVDYNYSNRYFVSTSAAVDGSSRFGTQTEGGFQLFNHCWGIFPSLNGAWLVSSEPFMKNVSAINLMKIRAGYGITGNDGITDYASKAYFSSVRYLGKANGLILSNVSNNKLQWETTGRASAGIDLGLLNERFNLSFDVYTSKTSDLLVWKKLREFSRSRCLSDKCWRIVQ